MFRFTFVLWCVAAFSGSIFGQSIETDLKKSFNKFSVVKINNRAAFGKAKSGTPFKIQINEKNFQFILKPNDIRSSDYKAEYTDNNGRHSLSRGEVFTYTGTIIGEPNSLVALTVDGTKIEGYLATEDEGFFIETAKKYSSRAKNDDQVIYQVKDKVNDDDNICGLDEAVAEGMKNASSAIDFTDAVNPQTERRRVLEVATEADIEAVEELSIGNGDPARANAHILSVMNQVDAVFERDLNLSVVVTFQHAWHPSNEIDPYTGSSSILYAFERYWNDNFPVSSPKYRRDVAHLFTRKLTLGRAGQAEQGVICVKPGDSYSFTSSLHSNKWGIVAHELGHNLGAKHTAELNPVPLSCTDTIMEGLGNSLYATKFCKYSIDQITDFVKTNGSCLHFEPSTAADFDADGKADISVFRPSNAVWYIQQSTGGFIATGFGLATDKLAPADYDGDGKTDVAVYRDGTWYLQRSTAGFTGVAFGASTDLPQPADFDGDGKADLAVFRPSNGFWYIFNLATNQFTAVQFGQAEDVPVQADYDGDGKADIAVYRPSNGTWYLQKSQDGFTGFAFGTPTDKPVPGDYDGDGKTDIAVFRPENGTWYLNRSRDGFTGFQFGINTDQPVPADYDGDGKADIAVFRDGTWYLQRSWDGFTGISFGATTDKPIPNAFESS